MFTEKAQYHNMKYDMMIESALLEHPETDGLFLNSDVIAAQALQVCRKLGRPVPEQMKIIGFDDVNIATLTTPQLTTIHQPVREMAEIAVNLLHDAVGGKVVPKRTVLPVYLVERETTWQRSAKKVSEDGICSNYALANIKNVKGLIYIYGIKTSAF